MILFDPGKITRESLQIISDLIGKFSGAIELYCHLFTFESLNSSAGAQCAEDMGADADLVILAVRCDQELPETVRLCLEKSIARKQARSAGIVALLEFSALQKEIEIRTKDFLTLLAHSKNLDLFVNELELAQAGVISRNVARIRKYDDAR